MYSNFYVYSQKANKGFNVIALSCRHAKDRVVDHNYEIDRDDLVVSFEANASTGQ